MTKYAVAVNFAVRFKNISTTIKHTFYMIPGYRSTWLISYTANMAQKLEILINRLMASAVFHGFFKTLLGRISLGGTSNSSFLQVLFSMLSFNRSSDRPLAMAQISN